MATVLGDGEIRKQMEKLQGWQQRGNEITKLFEHRDFVKALGFVNSVALLAERANHHPDIDIRWNKVTLVLSTHSAGGLTDLDFALARTIDEL